MVFLALELTAAFRPRPQRAAHPVGHRGCRSHRGDVLLALEGPVADPARGNGVHLDLATRRGDDSGRAKTGQGLGSDLLAGCSSRPTRSSSAVSRCCFASEPHGNLWVLSLLIVVVSTDTGAYAQDCCSANTRWRRASARRRPGRASAARLSPRQIASFLVGWLLLNNLPILDRVLFGSCSRSPPPSATWSNRSSNAISASKTSATGCRDTADSWIGSTRFFRPRRWRMRSF